MRLGSEGGFIKWSEDWYGLYVFRKLRARDEKVRLGRGDVREELVARVKVDRGMDWEGSRGGQRREEKRDL